MINKCNQCQIDYELSPSRAKKSKYCSQKCSQQSQKNGDKYKPSTKEIDNHIEFIKDNINNIKSVQALNLLCIENNILFSNDTRIKNIIKKQNLDISHFVSTRPNVYSNDELFVLGNVSRNNIVKIRILEENLIEYKCLKCGIIDEWNGKKIRLDLDHISGNSKDNSLKNLRFLCPSCHSQTDTHRGKNIIKNKER